MTISSPTAKRSANDKQIAGTHYKTKYQHWDMLPNIGYDGQYFAGQISKYLMRWRKKNGVRDILKAQHFLEKMVELTRSIGPEFLTNGFDTDEEVRAQIQGHMATHLDEFFTVNEVGMQERAIITCVLFANNVAVLHEAQEECAALLTVVSNETKQKPDLELPVSTKFTFNGYTQDDTDKMVWICKQCNKELVLQLDEPPTLAHPTCA